MEMATVAVNRYGRSVGGGRHRRGRDQRHQPFVSGSSRAEISAMTAASHGETGEYVKPIGDTARGGAGSSSAPAVYVGSGAARRPSERYSAFAIRRHSSGIVGAIGEAETGQCRADAAEAIVQLRRAFKERYIVSISMANTGPTTARSRRSGRYRAHEKRFSPVGMAGAGMGEIASSPKRPSEPSTTRFRSRNCSRRSSGGRMPADAALSILRRSQASGRADDVHQRDGHAFLDDSGA
ncbi:MAG: hypothetical protein R3C42_05640 [Parvularculaceae bacterium]